MKNQVWRVKLFKFRGRNSYLGEENVNTQKKINIHGERERERDDYVVFAADAEIDSDAVIAAESEIDSGPVFAANFSMNSDAELGGRGKTGFR